MDNRKQGTFGLKQYCQQTKELVIGLQANVALHLRRSLEDQRELDPRTIGSLSRSLESLHTIAMDAIQKSEKIEDDSLFIGDQINPKFLVSGVSEESDTISHNFQSEIDNEIWRITQLQNSLVKGLRNHDTDSLEGWVNLENLKITLLRLKKEESPDILTSFYSLAENDLIDNEKVEEVHRKYQAFKDSIFSILQNES